MMVRRIVVTLAVWAMTLACGSGPVIDSDEPTESAPMDPRSLATVQIDPAFVELGEWPLVDGAVHAWFEALPELARPVIIGFDEDGPALRIRRVSGPGPTTETGTMSGRANAGGSVEVWADELPESGVANVVAHEMGHVYGAGHHAPSAPGVAASAVMRWDVRPVLSCITQKDIDLVCATLGQCGETKAVCLKIPGVR